MTAQVTYDMLVLASVAVLCFITGLPLALTMVRRGPRGETSPSELLYDSTLIGLVVYLLAGLILMRLGVFGFSGLVVVGAGAMGLGALPLLKGEDTPRLRRPDLGPFPWAVAAVVLGALILRRNPIEFVFQIGDMGEYVNNAVTIVSGGTLRETFPHLYPIFLALPGEMFDVSYAVAAIPLTGVLLIGAILRLGGLLGVPAVPRLTISLIVAIGVVPVWFSIFPVSESLYAAVLLGSVVFLARAHVEDRPTLGIIAGTMVLVLGLLRGNALLLIPLMVLYLLGSAVAGRADRVDLAFVLTGLIGIFAAYAYNVAYLPGYYVGLQLDIYVPDRLFALATRIGLFRPGWVLIVASALFVAVVFLLWRGALRWSSAWASARDRIPWALRVLTLVAATVAVSLIGWAGVAGGVSRHGLVLLLAAGIGWVFGGRSTAGSERDRALWFVALVATAYGILYAIRFPVDEPHAYFLYWDRYLFSEVFPGLLVAGLIGLDLIWAECRPRISSRTLVALMTSIFLAAPLPLIFESLHATERQLFGEVFSTFGRLDGLASPDHVPIVYDGLEAMPEYWIFPNTYRAFALPLVTYGHDLVNLPRPEEAFGPDPTVGCDGLSELMRREGVERVLLVSLGDGLDSKCDDRDLQSEFVGELRYTSPILVQNPDGPEEWREALFAIAVLEVGLSR